MSTVENEIPTISLFTGAGGLDIGAAALGCHARVCVDLDSDSIETLRRSVLFEGSSLLERDITTLSGAELLLEAKLKEGEAALLIGGPPCQPFSKAAYWTSTGDEARARRRRAGIPDANESTLTNGGIAARARGRPRNPDQDPRANLIDEYVRILRETRPAAFVFENVMSITHPTNKGIFSRLLAMCQDAGYAITVYQANAAEFGVAQLRKRVFVSGILGATPPPEPIPTHMLPKSQTTGLLPTVTAGQAIEPYAGSEYAEPEEYVTGRWADHLHEIPPGWNYKALTEWAGHPNPSFVAETRFWSFLLKLHPEQPSWTIAANPGPWVGPFHWDSRRLRIPELAALQTFPHGYEFAGKRRSVRRQIGNAVPPRLAQSVVATVLGCLTGKRHDEMVAVAGG